MTLTPVRSTEAVLAHHLECFAKGDLAGILSDYTPESAVCTAAGVVRAAGLSDFFKGVFAEFGKPGMSFNMTRQTIEGDIAHIIWTAETADNIYDFATDTFLVRDGKIAVQTFAAKVTPK
jgi:SnoaL-like protein